MAKKAINKKRTTQRNAGTTPAPISLWQQLKQGELQARCKDIWSNFSHADNLRFIIGLCIMCISIYLIISFVSNVFTGRIDQSYVQNGELTHAANYGGRLGAYISNYFMDMCFGIFSLLIPIFTLLAGIKLVGNYHIRLWKWFLNFSIIMIWGSVFLSLITDVLPTRITNFFSFRLGGGHGDFVKNYLTNNLGSLGAWIVVLATAVFYLMYLTSETVNVVRRMMHPQDFIKNKLPRKDHAGDEADDENAEHDGADVTTLGEVIDDDDENEEYTEAQHKVYDLELSHNADSALHNDDSSASISIDLDTNSSSTVADSATPAAMATSEMEIHAPSSETTTTHKGTTDTQLDIAAPVVDDKAHGKTVEEVFAQLQVSYHTPTQTLR